jgi:predicted transcriptional regulator
MTTKPADTSQDPADADSDLLAAVDEGVADANAGRTVAYEKVRRWLLSWGSKKELPPPQCRSDSLGGR